MKSILSLKSHLYLKRVGILLIITALIAAMVGCANRPARGAIEIWDWYDLDAVRDNLSGSYVLMNDLDSTSPGYAELAGPTANGGKGWLPIGAGEFPAFQGLLDGQGYEIRDLFIDRPDEDKIGLFKQVHWPAVVRKLGIVDATVTGSDMVGILGGGNWNIVVNSHFSGNVTGYAFVGGVVGISGGVATLTECHSTVTVTGYDYVGGLVGDNRNTVSNCYSAGSVTGNEVVGGLVGRGGGTVSNSYSTASVTGDRWVGGLVGYNWAEHRIATVSNSHATGNVIGNYGVGGLVGENLGNLSNSYASGNVTGNSWVGGLAGQNSHTVSNSYAIGSVTGDEQVGGLLGRNDEGLVSNSYSAGRITGNWLIGGLVGVDTGTVTNSFWDIETSGLAFSDGGTGKTTAEMKDIVTFLDAGWSVIAVANPDQRDSAYTWNMVDLVTYPFLSWQSA